MAVLVLDQGSQLSPVTPQDQYGDSASPLTPSGPVWKLCDSTRVGARATGGQESSDQSSEDEHACPLPAQVCQVRVSVTTVPWPPLSLFPYKRQLNEAETRH